MLLAGDIGGTKTHLGIFEIQSDGKLKLVIDHKYPSQEFSSLEDIVDTFLKTANLSIPINTACFGVAGPIKLGRCEATNLPWLIDSNTLSTQFKIPHVFLLNDVEANGYGIETLTPDEKVCIHPGEDEPLGNRALLSAGTGLGQAGIFWDGSHYHPTCSEGGHADFAPRNAMEIELWQYLYMKFNHVSWERVCSGRGIEQIFLFLRDKKKMEEPSWLRKEFLGQDIPKVISEFALAGKSEICQLALDHFIQLYGAAAGNVALHYMSLGGMYLGGGIAPKLLSKMQSPLFLEAFFTKGRMRSLLEKMPIYVILKSTTALWGAAYYAYLKETLRK